MTLQTQDTALYFGHHGPPPKISLRHHIRRRLPIIEDAILDAVDRAKIARIKRSDRFRHAPRRRILMVGVQSDRRPGALRKIFARMASTRHEIVTDLKGVEGKGKLPNVNELLARHDLASFDWVFMVDDDVSIPRDFTDIFIELAELADFKICGPAQRAKSYASYFMTRRRYDSMVRETTYVEVGPITAFHRDSYADIFPLPNLRYGWGVDLTWVGLAHQRGWKIGIVDTVSIGHLNPIAASYDVSKAVAEARAYMEQHVLLPKEECWQTLHKINRYPR